MAYDETELRAAIAASVSWSEALRRLGRRSAGGNHATVKRYAAEWAIPTDHFDRYAGNRAARARRPLQEVLVEGSSFARGHLKERLFVEGLKRRECELCGQDEKWRGRQMALILDHVNGVSDDNRLENLQIVCPNCAATLDTHCGRNPARRELRACHRCESEFLPRYSQQRYCTARCSKDARVAALAGVERPERRKVVRPPYEQLMRELDETNYSAVGRKYGVSDNAVRKWVRMHKCQER